MFFGNKPQQFLTVENINTFADWLSFHDKLFQSEIKNDTGIEIVFAGPCGSDSGSQQWVQVIMSGKDSSELFKFSTKVCSTEHKSTLERYKQAFKDCRFLKAETARASPSALSCVLL